MTKRALLLANRNARKGSKIFSLAVEALHNLDFELIIIPTKSSQELAEIVNKHADRIDLVIVGGGDGTLNKVVDSLVEHKLPLGILPLGTANDLARTLSIPQSIPQACKVIGQGNIQYIDLGWVNNKYFFNVASMGLSVKITESLTKQAKSRWGSLAYALKAMEVISKTRPFRAKITVEGKSISVKTVQIAIGNGKYYGGGMAVAKDAAINDQRLDLYSLELKHWWQIFPLVWTLPRGEQAMLPWVRTIEGQEIEIVTSKPEVINTDGELTGDTPATFRVIPQALGVFAPIG